VEPTAADHRLMAELPEAHAHLPLATPARQPDLHLGQVVEGGFGVGGEQPSFAGPCGPGNDQIVVAARSARRPGVSPPAYPAPRSCSARPATCSKLLARLRAEAEDGAAGPDKLPVWRTQRRRM
jgi:hypothetical protein